MQSYTESTADLSLPFQLHKRTNGRKKLSKMWMRSEFFLIQNVELIVIFNCVKFLETIEIGMFAYL